MSFVRQTRLALCAIGFAGALAGCYGNETDNFAPGLAPLEANPAPDPVGTADDPTPEVLSLQQGHDSISDYVFARAYVHASIDEVWAALKDPAVVVDRAGVSSWSAKHDVEDYPVSFRTDYIIHDIITVEFEITWREGITVEATPTVAEHVTAQYQKTWGSTLVDMMAGSIELTAISPTLTEMSFVQRMNATQTSSDNIAAWTRELYASVLARVQGKALP